MIGMGGTEGFVYNVAKGLSPDEYDISVIVALSENCRDLFQRKRKAFEALGARIIWAGEIGTFPKGWLNFAKRLADIISFHGPFDIIHSNMDLINAVVLAVARRAGVKKRIAHAHNCGSQAMLTARIWKKILFKVYRQITRDMILFCATDLCGCSDLALNFAYGNRASKRGIIVLNGIDQDRFQKFEVEHNYISKELSRPEKKKYVISVGRVCMMKNPEFALEVIMELRKIRDDFDFLWVGLNVYEENMMREMRRRHIEDCVCFTGERHDIPELLNCADVLLMPSVFEGFGFTLVEAQATHTPCIASSAVTSLTNCGLCEYIEIKGDDAAKKWAQSINHVLNDKKDRVPDERINRFRIEHTVNQMNKIYNN